MGFLFGLTGKVKLMDLSVTADPFADDYLNGNKSDDPLYEFEANFAFASTLFGGEALVGAYLKF
jgi:hypothetical protein